MNQWKIDLVAPFALRLVLIGVMFCCEWNNKPALFAAEPGAPIVDVPDKDLKALVAGNNQFAIELFKNIAEKEKGNIVLSPYSISSALTMTYAGARGKTADEMAKTLGISTLEQNVHQVQHSLANKLENTLNTNRQEFRSRNSLWLNDHSKFENDFLQIAKSKYEAQATVVDFDNAPTTAVDAVNQWVDKETKGRIRNLLEYQDVSKGTDIVLANATYLKGLWHYPFDKSKTSEDVFHVTVDSTIKVKMMQHYISTSYWEGDGVKIASIAFQKNAASLMIIVPQQIDGLSALKSKLTAKTVHNWYTSQSEVLLTLRMPRLTIRYKHALESNLKTMGMCTPFNHNADFSGITSRGFGLSKVIHEAFVELNEEGAEAAAATAVVGVVPVMAKPVLIQKELIVNQPFCFVLYEHSTQSILFLGCVASPN